jgi:formyltetrahydrofolate deformylase
MTLSPAASSHHQVPDPSYVLTLSCPDRPGIVHAVAAFLVGQDCNIVESQQFGDRAGGTFFMRVHFESAGQGAPGIDRLRNDFTAIAEPFAMTWRLLDAAAKQRVLILVSKFGHCLNDLLYRAGSGALNIEVPAVISNHPDLGLLADSYDVPFRHLPVTPQTKADAEARLLDAVDELDIDLVVLARYMQILSGDLCKHLEGRAINIHHSMLPSFKGARPYHQAYERGVKLIGATAHYVTPDLDEGPIIEQEVARIDHTMTAAQVTQLGRDNECLALARAVQRHTENRVLLNGRKTVVFR